MEFSRRLSNKKKLVVGLMSGTSADGVDAALVEVQRSSTRARIRLLAFETYPYPNGFKKFLLSNSGVKSARLDDIARLNILIAHLFADAVKNVVRKAGKQFHDVDLIGSHGQTIHHLPKSHNMFGKRIRATLQLGDPSVIAKLTGVVTVGDFRVGDIGVGGSGAPLVPFVDYILLRSRTKNRAALNIGGIANMTILPKNCSLCGVRAFDTGPGNMIIDNLMERYFHRSFDRNGITASRGRILPSLLHWMAQHPYLRTKPPKSTGREMFGDAFIGKIINRSKGEKKEDVVATVTEFTAFCIYDQYLRFVKRSLKLEELLVSGGGVHNAYLTSALRRYFSGVDVQTTDEALLTPDAKEAVAFALLANETIAGNSSNVPGATGARRATVLGKICLP